MVCAVSTIEIVINVPCAPSSSLNASVKNKLVDMNDKKPQLDSLKTQVVFYLVLCWLEFDLNPIYFQLIMQVSELLHRKSGVPDADAPQDIAGRDLDTLNNQLDQTNRTSWRNLKSPPG